MEFICEKTGLDKETVKSAYFEFLEECPSGLMTRNKFIEIHEKLHPTGEPEKFCNLAFKAFDTDNNGKIDFNEFCIALAANGSDSDLKKCLENAFRIYDVNRDGKISKKEMRKAIEAIFELKGNMDYEYEEVEGRVDEIFRKYDKDKNDFINIDELIAGLVHDPKMAFLLCISFSN